jgi:hypothetical protein
MRLPKQSKPIARSVSSSPWKAGLAPSQSKLCDLCLIACAELSGNAKTLCILACNAAICG